VKEYQGITIMLVSKNTTIFHYKQNLYYKQKNSTHYSHTVKKKCMYGSHVHGEILWHIWNNFGRHPQQWLTAGPHE